MKVEHLKIEGALLLMPDVYGDHRGFFFEMWNRRVFRDIGLDVDFVQDNHSRSGKHVLRGLHYQVNGHAQGKLVWVSSGSIFDVIVDLREDSPTFGVWDGRLLTSARHERLWAPPGCAHGFVVVSDMADFHYKCSDFYSPADERVLRWNDPAIGIEWPIPPGVEPLLSERDKAAPGFLECEKFPAGKDLGYGFPARGKAS